MGAENGNFSGWGEPDTRASSFLAAFSVLYGVVDALFFTHWGVLDGFFETETRSSHLLYGSTWQCCSLLQQLGVEATNCDDHRAAFVTCRYVELLLVPCAGLAMDDL